MTLFVMEVLYYSTTVLALCSPFPLNPFYLNSNDIISLARTASHDLMRVLSINIIEN